MKVWTKQHKNVWKELEETGRYIVSKQYVGADMQEYRSMFMEIYDWLTKTSPGYDKKPQDVKYPVWVSLESGRTMMPEDGYVVLELEIDPEMITRINVGKWGMILNFSYIPLDEADAKKHQEKMQLYGVDDVKAVMTNFYPELKREIWNSWDRLFDETVKIGNDLCYGMIWEIKKEWITKVIQ